MEVEVEIATPYGLSTGSHPLRPVTVNSHAQAGSSWAYATRPIVATLII